MTAQSSMPKQFTTIPNHHSRNSMEHTTHTRRHLLGALLAAAALATMAPKAEAKGRTGSKRVGGSGRSGKGGRYVGGRK
jgi:hypothetical protein